MSLHSPSTRVPRIVLQRIEEVFPAVRETMVSVCTGRNIFVFIPHLQAQTNQMFCNKVTLIFIIHVMTIFMDGCGCYSHLACWVLE
jgi:hypothetical protein